MTKVNWRAVPSGTSSVYLEVSSRDIMGCATAFRRRSHLIWVTPSQPGMSRRMG